MKIIHFYAGVGLLCASLWLTRGREVHVYTRPLTINSTTNVNIDITGGHFFGGSEDGAALIINQ